MKKLFIIAAAACVTLASCVKNEPVQTPETLDQIAFEAPVVAPNTKVAEMLSAFGTADFKVWANFTEGVWDATADNPLGTNAYIDGEVVKHDETVWAFETARYWPKNGYLHFSAIYPSNVADASVTSEGIQISSYTVPTDRADQVDLLISDRICDQVKTGNPVKSVPVVFNHALSAINFLAKAEGPTIVINSITISGVKGTASFNQLLDEAKDSNWANEEICTNWTTAGDPVSYEAYSGERTLDATVKYVQTGNADDNYNYNADLMLIPQDLTAEGQKVRVNYTMNGASGQVAEFELDGTWGRGYRYNYTLTFTGDQITFTASVKDWKNSENNTL